jgi:hypothetical protein
MWWWCCCCCTTAELSREGHADDALTKPGTGFEEPFSLTALSVLPLVSASTGCCVLWLYSAKSLCNAHAGSALIEVLRLSQVNIMLE